MNRKQRPKGPRKGRFDQRMAVATIPRPPEIKNTGLVYTTRRRFLTTVASAGIGVTVTYANLLDSYLVATSGTTGVQLFDGVKIRAVEIWVPSTSTGVPTTSLVCFDGKTLGAQGDLDQHSATSMGIEPAHILARPARRSQASQWQATSASTAFVIFTPINAVVDLTLTFRNSLDNSAPVALANVLTGATAGDIYLRAFDGKAVAASSYLALGTVAIQ